MSSNENDYGLEHLLGSASLPRNVNPTLRGTIRRADPDGGSSVPYFSGLNGTSLTVEYGAGSTVLSFSSDGYQAAIDYINTVDASNLLAFDSDGYLSLMNLNSGNKNYLKVESGDAAPILGFLVEPYPGYISYAGEVQSASAGRVQGEHNAPGTSLVGADEDLDSGSINKALAGFAYQLYRRFGTTDILIPIVLEVGVSVTNHSTGGSKKVFTFSDDPTPNLRMPLTNIGFTGYSPSGNELDSVVCLLDSTTGEPVVDVTQSDMIATVQDVYYEEGDAHTLDNTALFSSWGTPDGKSIFKNPDVLQKIKHAATTITSISGDVIHCSGATFSTNHCWKGDTLEIESADNNVPFNHNGEYIITDVLDEETVRVRHAQEVEALDGTAARPTALNPNLPGGTSYGTAKVLIGKYFPVCSADSPPDPHVVFEVPSWVATGSYKARILTARRLSSIQPCDLVRPLHPRPLGKAVRDHINAAYNDTMHTDGDVLASYPKTSGSYTLSGTDVEAQLNEIVAYLDAMSAGLVLYNGGPDWADGTLNSGAGYPKTIEAQFDKNIGELAAKTSSNDGAAKIGTEVKGDFTAGNDNIRKQLDDLDVNWFKITRNGQNVSGWNTFSNENTFSSVQKVGHFSTATIPAFKTLYSPEGGNERKLLWQAIVSTTPPEKYARFYSIQDSGDTSGGFEFTYNCYYESPLATGVWACDNSGDDAICYRFEGGNFKILFHSATGSTWNDVSWTNTRLDFDYDGDFTQGLLAIDGNFETNKKITAGSTIEAETYFTAGSELWDTAGEAAQGRYRAQAVTSTVSVRTRMLYFPNTETANNYAISVWRGNWGTSDTLEIVGNAEWNNATNQWSRQTTGKDSWMISYAENSIFYFWHDSGSTSPWTDASGWDRYLRHKLYPNIADEDVGSPETSPYELNTGNLVKSWGVLISDSNLAPEIVCGYNINSVEVVALTDILKINFKTPLEEYYASRGAAWMPKMAPAAMFWYNYPGGYPACAVCLGYGGSGAADYAYFEFWYWNGSWFKAAIRTQTGWKMSFIIMGVED